MLTLGPKIHPAAKPEPQPDFIVEGGGTLFTVRPLNENARLWLNEHTDGSWFGGALCVEHRFILDLVDGILNDGFTVK